MKVSKGASRSSSLLRLRMQQVSSFAAKERANQILQRKNEDRILVISMCQIESQEMSNRKNKDKKCHCFAQANILKVGLKKFGQKGKERARKEVKKLNDRTEWKTIYPNNLTKDEKRNAMESLIFLSEKRDRTMKGRMYANESTQRIHIPK